MGKKQSNSSPELFCYYTRFCRIYFWVTYYKNLRTVGGNFQIFRQSLLGSHLKVFVFYQFLQDIIPPCKQCLGERYIGPSVCPNSFLSILQDCYGMLYNHMEMCIPSGIYVWTTIVEMMTVELTCFLETLFP